MTQAITKSVVYTPEQLALITRTVAQGATKDELTMFLHVAKKSKLDPFLRQIHFVKRAGKATIQVGIDGYRAIADRTGQYAGNSEPVYEYDTHGQIKKATVTVYRFVNNQKCEFSGSALWDEYCPPKGQDFMWQKMPHVMLAKVAETIALRKAFPNDLAGLYTQEEMAQSGQYIEGTAAYFSEHTKKASEAPKAPEVLEENLPVIQVEAEELDRTNEVIPEEPVKEESPFARAIKKTSGAKFAQ